jgi:hypothetical protein
MSGGQRLILKFLFLKKLRSKRLTQQYPQSLKTDLAVTEKSVQ